MRQFLSVMTTATAMGAALCLSVPCGGRDAMLQALADEPETGYVAVALFLFIMVPLATASIVVQFDGHKITQGIFAAIGAACEVCAVQLGGNLMKYLPDAYEPVAGSFTGLQALSLIGYVWCAVISITEVEKT